MLDCIFCESQKSDNYLDAGFNSELFYIGSRFSIFPLHTEELEFGALNLSHCGEPKIWV